MEEAMQDQSDNSPPKDLVDRKESDVSIGTQSEEENVKASDDRSN